jgi:hypothetical protein
VPAKTSISACAALLLLLCLPQSGLADEAAVPPRLQASLIARVAPFDRSLVARARSRVLLLVAIRRDDAGSRQVAAEVVEALKSETQIAGLPLEVATIEVAEAQQLVEEIRVRRPSILYLSTAFSGDAAALAASLSGEDVLTIAAESEAVSRGICVGFDLVSGKPHVLIHLQQSKKQHVNFQATLLHLAKVVDQ